MNVYTISLYLKQELESQKLGLLSPPNGLFARENVYREGTSELLERKSRISEGK